MLRPPFSQEPIPINNWDVIVVGAGAAGLMTCLELPSNLKVLLLNRNTSKVSSSRWAQGGIASVVRQDDSFDLHAEDTLLVFLFKRSTFKFEGNSRQVMRPAAPAPITITSQLFIGIDSCENGGLNIKPIH